MLEQIFGEKFGTSIIHSERILPVVCPPWWKSPELFIEPSAKEAISAHGNLVACTLNELIAQKDSLNIYTDGSGIDGEVGAAAWCPQLQKHKGASIGPLNCFTVYFGELYDIRLALEIAAEDYSGRTIRIFADNQAALRAVNAPSGSSEQYALRDIFTTLDRLAGRRVKLHWIPAHVSVPDNERADDLAKRANRGSGPP